MEDMLEILDQIGIVISLVGSVIIVWGVLITLFQFLKLEVKRFRIKSAIEEREFERYRLGTYLLMGLDFLLASDIIQTIHHPELPKLYALGMIVAIRFVLSYLLQREKEIKNSN